MGRARRQLSAVGLVDRRDSFAATFGVTRGHAGLNALLGGQNTPPARAEAARLAAQARAGDYAESLEILHRVLASKPILMPVVAGPKVSRPMELVLTALVEGAAARTAESNALRTKKLMDELMLRTRSCQHIIYEQDRATGERVLHFTAAPDRLRGANDSLDLVCGRCLEAGETMWGSAVRGEWKLTGKFDVGETGCLRCPTCAEHTCEYAEEADEGQSYPPLSGAQRQVVLDETAQQLRCNLPGTLNVYGAAATEIFEAVALDSYRTGLTKLASREYAAAGEWPFREGPLHAADYRMLLAQAADLRPGCRALAGLLDEETWEEILSAVVFDALPPADLRPPEGVRPPQPRTIGESIVNAVRDLLWSDGHNR